MGNEALNNEYLGTIFENVVGAALTCAISGLKKENDKNISSKISDITEKYLSKNMSIEDNKDIDNEITPGFLFKRENGEIESEPVIITEDHPDYETDVVNIVVNDPTVKELKLNIRPEDVMINSDGKIVVRIFHNGVPEIYRFDIIQDKLYVQAPLNKEYINFNDRMIYKFVTVPINSIEGKNIVTNPNYFVDLDAINSDTAPGVIFRINDTAI